MGGPGTLRARGLQSEAAAQRPDEDEFPHPAAEEQNDMRLPKRWDRRLLVLCVALGLAGLAVISLPLFETRPTEPLEWHVDPAQKQLVHRHVQSVLDGPCRSGSARQGLLSRLSASGQTTQPFLWRDTPLPDELFLFSPPFGFRGLQDKLKDLLELLPDSSSQLPSTKCSHCVVLGNGGLLRGLELGPLINKFDVIIRLNSGPLGEFIDDVGNRTSIRMSYPEGTPLHWVDTDPQTLFVAVIYKAVDISWISAMIKKLAVPLWDWLFFWQKVPAQIPLEPQRFRLLNPEVIRETALDLLKYPPPRPRLWGWDQNVPTLGVSAVTLASLLCDQVSLAGFGYNLSQRGAPLHYYDHLPMSAMLQQKMHNVNRETELLQSLAKAGTITDLTGGIYPSVHP